MRFISVSWELLAFDWESLLNALICRSAWSGGPLIPKILDPALPLVFDATKTKYLGGQFNSEIGQVLSLAIRENICGPPPPPFIVPWESEILGPYFIVVMDAIGPETDFTLETDRKRVKEKLLKRT